MKERPILFSAPMVRALLAGTKTQTRRVFTAKNGGVWPNRNDLPGMKQILRNCPYGRPGDRLWVRETWTQEFHPPREGEDVFYRADGEVTPEFEPWIPSIHMFRWASRITLEIVGVRVERLQDISWEDAIAEGVEMPFGGWVGGYQVLWESINGNTTAEWAANPWVWVVEFRRVQP